MKDNNWTTNSHNQLKIDLSSGKALPAVTN